MKKALLLTLISSSIFSSSPIVAQLAATNLNSRLNHSAIGAAHGKIKPILIDEEVPDIEFTMINYPERSARLSDFEGKLVIVDFWDTHCAACIFTFPKIDSLQQRYKERVQFMLVNAYNTGDNEAKITEFFKRRKNTNNLPFQLSTAINDSVAVKFFPHKEIPHYAWIGPDGKLKAITSSKQVTAENIEKILKDGNIKIASKKDFYPDRLLDLPVDMNIDDFTHYSFFRKGKLEGQSTLNRLRQIRNGISKESTTRGRAMRNMPLIDIYKGTLFLNKEFRSIYNDKKLILEVTELSTLIFDSTKTTKDNWEKANLYTYDMIVPALEADSLYNYMLQDLNRYSGYYGRIEKRNLKCLVLVRTTESDKVKTSGGKSSSLSSADQQRIVIHNLPVSHLISELDRIGCIQLPFINETGYMGNIDIELPANPKDIIGLRKILQQYDLDLIEKVKELDVFVITDNKIKKQMYQ